MTAGPVSASAFRISTLAVAAAALTGVQVGAAIVATRFVIDQTSPASLALLRYAIGCACLLPPALLRPRPRFAGRDLLAVALLGVVQFGVVVALLNYALRTVPSARAALLFATFPLMTMLLAALLGRERLTRAKTIGVVLTIAGVGLALGEKVLAPGASWLGALAVLASAASGAACSVLYGPYVGRYDPVPVGAVAMLASVAFLAVPAAGEGFFAAVPRFTPGGWLAVVFIGLSSGVGYFLWLWALRHATPTRVTVFLALSPVTAAVLGIPILGEPLTEQLAAAVLVVSAGLWLALRGPDAEPSGAGRSLP